MPRKIQRKPTRHLLERVPEGQTNTKGISIQEAVTILGGLTGIIVAILWIAGRFYAAGYFGAMNIPSFQINFSIWEYAEASWLKLIFFFLKKIFPLLVFIAVISISAPLSTFLLQTMFPKLKFYDATKNLVSQIRGLPSGIRYVFTFSITIYFSYLFFLALIDINKSGQAEGRSIVLNSSYAVEVYSKDYLPLSLPGVMPSTTPTLIQYSGLRLLTFNNGKYYLFRDVDPLTCKPSQVFIIPDTPDTYIVLSAIAPIDSSCPATTITAPTQ